MKTKEKKIFAAIDFGTRYSRHACGFITKDELGRNATDISQLHWLTDTHENVLLYKAPMSILFHPDQTFHSFGYEANSYYRNNSGKIDFKDWYFFEQVQIKLDTHKDNLTQETIIEDSRKNGSNMKALDVFASIIHYFKYRLLNVSIKRNNDEQQRYTDSDIHWVLTLPAISDLNTKIVMKDAATKAGISDEQLTFALKPDAVSLYCLEYILSSETTQTIRQKITSMPQEFQFILYDQGEDTTDITVLGVTGPKELRKIYQAHDGRCGGNLVNSGFFNYLTYNVVKAISGLVENVKIPSVANITTLIAVGNFSKSNVIVRSIEKKFPNVAVIVPENPEIVVLKGAILCEKVESESLLSRLPKMNMSDFKNLMSKGDYASYENRVFLAGACNVGKSCLASILIGEEIPKKWYSTDGLTIYFGRNGIHLEDRKMIPLKKFETSIVNKLLLATPEMKFDDKQHFEIFENNSTLTIENEPDDTDISGDKDLNVRKLPDQYILKDQIQTKEEQLISFDKTKNDKIELPPLTPNILQQTAASIQRDILQEIREGKYKIEIAPSDLVDFGGQRSYDMTHQLFVQHKGTFIIMFDGRFGLHKPLEEYNQQETAEDILIHWVNSILLYCKDDDDIMPMILFAATHSDFLKTDILAEKRIRITQELVKLFSTHIKSRHIMYDRLFFINATNSNDPEIEMLKDTLVDIAFSQSNWGQRMPLAWVPIEIQISEMRLKDVSLIPKESIQELNQSNKDFTLSEYSLHEFLKFQHSSGKILYFDTEGLDDFIVVQPMAMVNILRSFITDKLFWPKQKDLRWILENISSTGKVQKGRPL
ncbi:unnamed protein product [Mytilus edulis]|uniref:Uncharacterized protein n=1 Tax=Mytilus edulis TaxID=6550 RepID=A0A8S3VAQ5_MYTED|nr:unnamed protein product [Mytilus edulis]